MNKRWVENDSNRAVNVHHIFHRLASCFRIQIVKKILLTGFNKLQGRLNCLTWPKYPIDLNNPILAENMPCPADKGTLPLIGNVNRLKKKNLANKTDAKGTGARYRKRV